MSCRATKSRFLGAWTHREIGRQTEGTIDRRIEPDDETEGRGIKRGEDAGEGDCIVDIASNGACEVDADVAVESRDRSGLRARE